MGDKLGVALFLEDAGHQRFIDALVRRLADEDGVAVEIDVRNARGGASQLDGQFTRFLRDNATLDKQLDLVVVIRDTDCRGVDTIKTRYFRLIDDVGYLGEVVVGAPEPHIECWYLSDPAALQRVLSSGVQAPVPDSKCGSGRFKRLLSQTVKDAGVEPAEGGIEYAGDIVEEMDIYRACTNVPSLDTFVRDFKRALRGHTEPTQRRH